MFLPSNSQKNPLFTAILPWSWPFPGCITAPKGWILIGQPWSCAWAGGRSAWLNPLD